MLGGQLGEEKVKKNNIKSQSGVCQNTKKAWGENYSSSGPGSSNSVGPNFCVQGKARIGPSALLATC